MDIIVSRYLDGDSLEEIENIVTDPKYKKQKKDKYLEEVMDRYNEIYDFEKTK